LNKSKLTFDVLGRVKDMVVLGLKGLG